MRLMTMIARGAAILAAGLLLGWPAWAGVRWLRYGHVPHETGRDPLLDRYLPTYEVAESHETRVSAPASLTYAVAMETGMQQLSVARTMIRWRERLMGIHEESPWPPGGIPMQMRAWGWGLLAEVPGREIILGTVTQPWRGDVHFRALAPSEFAAFRSPGYVKIVLAIAAEPADHDSSRFRIRTRVASTDPTARARFRRYWAVFSPGILLIRYAALHAVKSEAERHDRARLCRRIPA